MNILLPLIVATAIYYGQIGIFFFCPKPKSNSTTPEREYMAKEIFNKAHVCASYENVSNVFRFSNIDETETVSEKKTNFSYKKPFQWHQKYPECAGAKQSPIDLKVCQLREVIFKDLEHNNAYYMIPTEMGILSDNYTIILTADYPLNTRPQINGGPLNAEYIFQSLQFHWGTSNNEGSEHTVDGSTFPMEMHVLHKRHDLYRIRNGSDPLKRFSKYVIVAYFFNLSRKCNPYLQPIVKALKMASAEPHVRHKLEFPFALSEFISPFKSEYVTYGGSLTRPPCTESVTWIICPHPLPISARQLSKFRKIADNHPSMSNNFRPIQPLYSRSVFYAI